MAFGPERFSLLSFEGRRAGGDPTAVSRERAGYAGAGLAQLQYQECKMHRLNRADRARLRSHAIAMIAIVGEMTDDTPPSEPASPVAALDPASVAAATPRGGDAVLL